MKYLLLMLVIIGYWFFNPNLGIDGWVLHLLGFIAIGYLFRKHRWLWLLPFAEFLHLLTNNRDFELNDLIFNFIGIFIVKLILKLKKIIQ